MGRDQSIEVYENGKMIHEIQPKTSRGYGFRIQPNDTIELIVDPLIYTLDLQGNVISETPVGDKDGNTPVHNYRSVQATNGAVYNLENTLGYYRIVCNGKTVYRMPTLDYIVLLLMVGNFVRAAVMIPRLIVRWKKYDEQQKRRQI